VYVIDGLEGIDIVIHGGETEHLDGYLLNPLQSQRVFNRDKMIQRVLVHFKNKDSFKS
jgi:hypothetical protein